LVCTRYAEFVNVIDDKINCEKNTVKSKKILNPKKSKYLKSLVENSNISIKFSIPVSLAFPHAFAASASSHSGRIRPFPFASRLCVAVGPAGMGNILLLAFSASSIWPWPSFSTPDSPWPFASKNM
jgi:hypothetical protein